MTNVSFAEAIKLGHANGDRFGFQMMDDKVKDN